jgi:hypothetical protein
MKRRLLFVAALALALSLQFSTAEAGRNMYWDECFNENYGGGNCGMTCVSYNAQGSVTGYMTAFFAC